MLVAVLMLMLMLELELDQVLAQVLAIQMQVLYLGMWRGKMRRLGGICNGKTRRPGRQSGRQREEWGGREQKADRSIAAGLGRERATSNYSRDLFLAVPLFSFSSFFSCSFSLTLPTLLLSSRLVRELSMEKAIPGVEAQWRPRWGISGLGE